MGCAACRQVLNLGPLAGAVVLLVLGVSFASAQSDLTVTATWDPNCDPCTAGQRLTFVNTVTNLGQSSDPSVHIQMATAALGTTPVMGSWTTTQGEYDADGQGNVPFTDDSGLAYLLSAELGVMTPNTTATLTYQVDLDLEAPAASELTVNFPADLAGPWVHRAASFGQPFSTWDATADLEWVDDGSPNPTQGCGAPVGFTPDHVAVVDRGNCEFGLKALVAELAGARAAIIVNDVEGLPILMGGGVFGGDVTIPVLMITRVDGAILRARMPPAQVGDTVNASLRTVSSAAPGEPWVVSPEETGFPSMWAWGAHDPDCCPTSDPEFPACCGDGSNNLVYLAVSVSPGGQPTRPNAGFSWSPASPTVGATLTLTNTTTGTPPITYEWAFGDGATSTDAAPTHAYAEAGTFTVSLTATNTEGSDTATHDITVTAEVQLNELYFLAAAANAAGAAGSYFVTDLEVNNAGTTDMSYRFLWLPRDTDNSNPTGSDVFTLAAGASVRYENVLNEVFAVEDVFGALVILADSADAIVMSRTFDQTDNGTFGQAVDGLHSSELIQAGERMRVVFMTEDDAYRSNLGLLNGTGGPLTVMVARYDTAGDMLGDMVSVELDPWENTQLNRVLQSFAPVAGYVEVWTETAGGAFAAYGSVLDNVTSDPTTVNPR